MTAFTYTDRTGDAEWRESTHEERRKAAQRGSSAHAQRGSTQCKDAAAAHRPLNLLLAIVDADANLDDEPTIDARLEDAYAVRVDDRLRSKHPMNHQAHEGAQDEQRGRLEKSSGKGKEGKLKLFRPNIINAG